MENNYLTRFVPERRNFLSQNGLLIAKWRMTTNIAGEIVPKMICAFTRLYTAKVALGCDHQINDGDTFERLFVDSGERTFYVHKDRSGVMNMFPRDGKYVTLTFDDIMTVILAI